MHPAMHGLAGPTTPPQQSTLSISVGGREASPAVCLSVCLSVVCPLAGSSDRSIDPSAMMSMASPARRARRSTRRRDAAQIRTHVFAVAVLAACVAQAPLPPTALVPAGFLLAIFVDRPASGQQQWGRWDDPFPLVVVVVVPPQQLPVCGAFAPREGPLDERKRRRVGRGGAVEGRQQLRHRREASELINQLGAPRLTVRR
mmetsp:Transcript_16148/g.45967  ORF Transcript_16148/g.45967 Transcript_16148/m.45967 type:complete len:201 (-) Transcript_16148:1902-2504(-)